jgi:hypothetical protein
MGKTTEITPVMAHDENLKAVSARFKRWRETRVRGQYIPRQLWAEAVELAMGCKRLPGRCALTLTG